MNDRSSTYGQPSSGLYESLVLTWSLENKLAAKIAELGSTLYRTTWKERVTPLGRHLPSLVVTERPSKAKEHFGWRRPMAGNPGCDRYGMAGNTDSSRHQVKVSNHGNGTIYRFIPILTGEIPTGLDVRAPITRWNGVLSNPAHTLWLMLGCYGTDWLKCAEQVTRSTSRKRADLSKP